MANLIQFNHQWNSDESDSSSSIIEETHQVLFNSTVSILEQAIRLLNSIEDDQYYTKVSNFVPGSTIGKHIRHILEHFDAIISGFEDLLSENQFHDNWLVQYDTRVKDKLVESNVEAAIHRLSRVIDSLKPMMNYVNHPVQVLSLIDPNHPEELSTPSTFGRELWFSAHHAIHHYALIKVILIENGLPFEKELGFAPTTLQRQKLSSSDSSSRSSPSN